MLQFDKTRIAVRERSYLDLLDLALRVVRAHAWPLLLTGLLGIGPVVLLNIWLLGGEPLASLLEADEFDYAGWLFLYVILLSWLVVLEMPLATAPITLYLGMAVFEEKPRPWALFRQWMRSLPQLLLYQVLLRALLVPWFITWLLLYAVWPYLNELILLERNPLLRQSPGGMSTFRRSSNLHVAGGGDLFARWIAGTTLGLAWGVALWLAVWYLRGMLTGTWRFDWAMYAVYVQLVAWVVIGYFTVVRFLSYLDLRIRSEGWEVELRMRAEAARLTRQWAQEPL